MALLHAAHRGDYRAVVTWAALSNLDRWDDATKALWRRQGWFPIVNARTGQEFRLQIDLLEDFEAHADKLDVRAACRRLATDVLLVHGADDESVDSAAQAELAGLLRNVRCSTLSGTGHTFGANHPLTAVAPSLRCAVDETLDFFSKRLHERPTESR
jgi:pimeloyl-ACP methyl ester carboxylesterase